MGQNLMTFERSGTIAWATPQTHALMAKARLTPDWQADQLSHLVKDWLDHSPQEGNRFEPTHGQQASRTNFSKARGGESYLGSGRGVTYSG
ncbi:hypothetical protein OA79_13110 [Marinomonas sp. TW1]|nr:hypothetical protein OA79_13110 [Marinomonas sp. TW1]